jgi:heme-degrading monooxygenase HmoA
MIRSVLTLRAKRGRSQALEDFYREHGIIERALRFPGCHDVVLLRSTDGGADTHLVVADWDDSAAYAAWLADPWRVGNSSALADLLDIDAEADAGAPVVGRLYEPVIFDSAPEPTAEPTAGPAEELS